MADYTSQFVPTYQYMLTYEGSLSYLNQTGVPSKSAFINLSLSLKLVA